MIIESNKFNKSNKNDEINKLLRIEGLDFSINDAEILKDISLEADAGEFIGLIGPNGAGKTTLLKCINGINAASGKIELEGEELDRLSSKATARKVSLMHQNTTVTFPFPALDIVLTGRYPHLKRTRGESSEDYEIARKYMDYTDTLKFEKKPITQISGGERQRVLFAKVLAQETGLILLDEPTASLDIAHEEQIFKYSAELCLKGRTVIAAVHDLKVAANYCTRLVLMKDGRIISDGLPEEVLTADNLSKAFDVNALVYRNKVSGQLDFFIHGYDNASAGKIIHVIGGGGSASGIIRLLFEYGFKVSAGVFAHGDSDLSCAEVYGIKCLVGKPFSEISDECHQQNIELIKKADITILCDMPFGIQNLRNLEAAQYAKRLILIEDEKPEGRDFTGGKALELYSRLKGKATVINEARLHEVL